jgi:acyl dehydratase
MADASSATITDEAVERLNRRRGIPVKWGERPRNTASSADSIRQFAIGYGDDNPLFTDSDYAEGTRWQAPLAPPLYYMSAGNRRKVAWTDEQTEAMAGGDPLRGVGQYMTSERWAFVRAVTPGMRLWKSQYLDRVDARESEFAGGRVVVLTHRILYTDDDGQIFALNERDYHHADRKASGETGKYRDIQIVPYSDEEMEAIGVAYENEFRRGSERLRVDQVSAGDELPEIVKGPLTVSDIMGYHVGLGWGGMGAGPLKLAYKNRKRVPGFYTKNSLNVYDVAQRCHWEAEFAQELGHPAAYDYGAMRTNWTGHLITNWMGDDAWISRLSTRIRRFNYVGDTQWMRGRVESIDVAVVPAEVHLVLEAVNQRGETTCQGTATVLLSSSDGVVPELPTVSSLDDLPEKL